MDQRVTCVAPRAGFEPATNRLTAGCSTTELPGNRGSHVSGAAYSKPVSALQRSISYFLGAFSGRHFWQSATGTLICAFRRHTGTEKAVATFADWCLNSRKPDQPL